ncbi:MAG: hypothetical protein ACREA3_01775 [Nitrosotalea sp.]
MRIDSILFVLTVSLVIGSAPVFGQTPNPSSLITVMTDKSSYSDGDQMTISGTVSSQLNVPISIIIKDPTQNPVEIGQVSVNSDNTYSTQVTTGGRLWTTTGTYEVDVTYGSATNIAKTTFEFTSKTTEMPSNMTGTGNQTVPEFGPMAFIILSISMMSLVFYMRTRPKFRMP